MNISSFEFNSLVLSCYIVIMHCQTFAWYLISRKQFISEFCNINPARNLRLLQYSSYSEFQDVFIGWVNYMSI